MTRTVDEHSQGGGIFHRSPSSGLLLGGAEQGRRARWQWLTMAMVQSRGVRRFAVRSGTVGLPPLRVAALWLTLGLANAWFLAWTLAEMLLTDSAADWSVFERTVHFAGRPEMYAAAGPATMPWSPIAAWALIPIVAMGLTAWRILHIAAALALPNWRLRLLVLASWPFWVDVSLGNLLTFVLVAAVYAMRGNRLAIGSILVVSLLIPRPLMIPIVVWILWHHREWRWPFVGMFAVHAGLVLLSGLGGLWVQTVLGMGSTMLSWIFNVGPSRVIGLWWLAIGLPLGAWLLWRGRVGWSALAVSPYLNPYYLLFALLPSGDRVAADRVLVARPGV